MNAILMDRRRLLGAGIAITSLPFLGARATFAQSSANIRMIWWGGDARARLTSTALDLFHERHPDIAVTAESMGWDDYWARLATQVAGGNAPDFIQMDYRFMFEYARRGALLPLNDYLGNQLQLSDFGQENLDSCSVDGVLYGGNVGVNVFSVLYNSAAWEESGVAPPEYNMTWEAFADRCGQFAAAGRNGRMRATADGSSHENLLEAWLLGQGKALYNPDGTLGYDAADAGTWFAYWAEMRKAGSCVAPDVQALYKQSADSSPIVTGHAATDFAYSNQFEAYQGLAQAELNPVGVPHDEGAQPSQYLKPSQLFSISSRSRNPEAVATLINFLIAEPDGARILGLDRGVPASPAIREVIMPDLQDNGRKVVDLVSRISENVCPLPPAPPRGAGEVYAALIRISQEVGFEAVTPEQGGANLVDEAASILQRA